MPTFTLPQTVRQAPSQPLPSVLLVGPEKEKPTHEKPLLPSENPAWWETETCLHRLGQACEDQMICGPIC